MGNTPVGEGHLDSTGGEFHFFNKVVEALVVEVFDNLVAVSVAADCADNAGVQSELFYVVGEVGGCAADFFCVVEYVPQSFAHAYNFLFHDMDFKWIS